MPTRPPSAQTGTKLLDAALETRPCPVCGEQIWREARKCTHCGTDFTWRRYLSFGNTALALMTALVAVVASSAPALHLLLSSSNSNIDEVFAGIRPGGDLVNMLFSNYGRRSGVVDLFYLVFSKDKVELQLSLRARGADQKDLPAIVVDPDKTILVTYYLDRDTAAIWASEDGGKDFPDLKITQGQLWLKSANCVLRSSIVNADGKQQWPTDILEAGNCLELAKRYLSFM